MDTQPESDKFAQADPLPITHGEINAPADPSPKKRGRPLGSKTKPKDLTSIHHTPFKAKFPRGPQFVVHVTKEIMEHARVRDSSHCMIAMAVRDVMPQMSSISVDLQTVRFSDPAKGFRYTYLTPRIGQVALVQFDQGVMPEPFSFRLYGAHVTRMARHPKVQTPRAMNEVQKSALAKARKVWLGKQNEDPDQLDRTSLASDGERRARRVGGAPPPLGNFAHRREFGLKAFKM